MPDRAPAPSPSEPASPGPSRAKARLLLPAAMVVAALAVFLIAFWPDAQARKKGHPRHGRSSDRGTSPVGGSGREKPGDLGNTSVTRSGGSPVGGRAAPRSRAKAEDWWYGDKEKPSRDKGDQWWYQDAKDAEDVPDPDRVREAEAPKKSGPDDSWWHD
ncbi:MAG TPA: hypothetical protein VJ385_05895 [Fibrobacteria bacterium]|nr:hypothetical protein [Fibrobacteria bacterium]